MQVYVCGAVSRKTDKDYYYLAVKSDNNVIIPVCFDRRTIANVCDISERSLADRLTSHVCPYQMTVSEFLK